MVLAVIIDKPFEVVPALVIVVVVMFGEILGLFTVFVGRCGESDESLCRLLRCIAVLEVSVKLFDVMTVVVVEGDADIVRKESIW